MARRSIPVETKTAVLEALRQENANIPAIATQFGLSVPTLYRWLKATNVQTAQVETTVA